MVLQAREALCPGVQQQVNATIVEFYFGMSKIYRVPRGGGSYPDIRVLRDNMTR